MAIVTPEPEVSWSKRVKQLGDSRFGRELALMLALNLMIAVMFVTISDSKDFLETYEVCNCIGFSIWGAFELLRLVVGERLSTLMLAPLAVPAGFVVGSKISAWL